jgi:fructoselysine and glucoselysine-specific PTS system IID component
VQTGLQVAGNMLPALGFALLLNLMFNKKMAPYFFLGFMLAAYLKLPVIAIGGFGLIIALLVTQVQDKPVTDDDDDFGSDEKNSPKQENQFTT